MWDKIAEFFSRLLPESFLKSLIDRFSRQLASRAPGALAKDLLKMALVLIVLGLLVDAWLYWSQKERRALLARRFKAVAALCRRAADGTAALVDRDEELYEISKPLFQNPRSK